MIPRLALLWAERGSEICGVRWELLAPQVAFRGHAHSNFEAAARVNIRGQVLNDDNKRRSVPGNVIRTFRRERA